MPMESNDKRRSTPRPREEGRLTSASGSQDLANEFPTEHDRMALQCTVEQPPWLPKTSRPDVSYDLSVVAIEGGFA